MSGEHLRGHDVRLRGKQVLLRPMVETDWDVLARWNSDPEVLWFSEGDDVKSRTLEEVQGIYRYVSQTAFCFIIEVEDRRIGECWSQQMNLNRVLSRYPGKECRRIDLTIGERTEWGQGYGTETIAALTRFGFEQEGADLMFGCAVGDHNPRCRRAFEKVGYTVDRWVENPPGAKVGRECDLLLNRDDFMSGPSVE